MAADKRRASLSTCRSVLLSLAVGLAPVAHGQQAVIDQLPELGDVSGNLMTPQEEKRLGQDFMRHIRASGEVLDEPVIEDYLQTLGNELVKHSSTPGEHFEFFLIDDRSINAFAGPAGHIGVHTGLLLTTENESELAAVLAHEIAHVSQHHLARTWQAASDMSTPNAALLIAAAVLGVAVGGDAGIAALMGGQAAIIQQQIDFTRANEQEADSVGISILADAGFEPRAMPSFFTRMGRANRSTTDLPEFLRTHPVTTSRIADALGRAESHPHRQRSDDLRYFLSRAALRERSFADPADAVGHFSRLLEDKRYHSELATRYGLALAQTRARQYTAAAQQLDHLLARKPDSIEFIDAAAKLEIARGQPAAASAELKRALRSQLFSYPLQLTLAKSLMLENKLRESRDLLLEMSRQYPADARTLELLAHAEGRIGDKTAAHEYLADHHYLTGNTSGAVKQLEIALKDKGLSFFERNRLESKLNAMRRELMLQNLRP